MAVGERRGEILVAYPERRISSGSGLASPLRTPWAVCVPHASESKDDICLALLEAWRLTAEPSTEQVQAGAQDTSVEGDVCQVACPPHQEGTVTSALPFPAVWVRTGASGWHQYPNLQK